MTIESHNGNNKHNDKMGYKNTGQIYIHVLSLFVELGLRGCSEFFLLRYYDYYYSHESASFKGGNLLWVI